MALTISRTTAEFSTARSKRFAYCYKIVRQDGTTFRFSSHDRKLTVDGETYTPVAGVDGSAKRKESALKQHDVEFRGVISATAITSSDLRAGRYRDAVVTEKIVDWRYPFAGPIATSIYWIGDVRFTGEVWEAEVAGLSRWLQHKVGSVYTRVCDAVLGDARCKFNLAGTIAGGLPATVSGVGVLGTVDGEKRRIVRADPATLSAAYTAAHFLHGKLTWTAGANVGLIGDVRLYTAATREIELQLPFPFEITTSDVFTITVGCNKLRSTCISTFSNLVNFRGDPFLPGTDKVLRITPG